LIQDSPALALLQIGDGLGKITQSLEFIAKRNDGTLKIKHSSDIQCSKFRLTPRNYEYAVLLNSLNICEDKEQLLHTIYQSLENSAQIILIEKKENSNLSELFELLDTTNFRAINDINIIDGYYLITAKKLHMWGAGL
jgi:hypothetical protein